MDYEKVRVAELKALVRERELRGRVEKRIHHFTKNFNPRETIPPGQNMITQSVAV